MGYLLFFKLSLLAEEEIRGRKRGEDTGKKDDTGIGKNRREKLAKRQGITKGKEGKKKKS